MISLRNTRMKVRHQRLNNDSGFTLIEVLIAVLVLSIGLLGLASLQMNALRNNQNSYYRTVATILANDFADRIRSNAAGVAANGYNAITRTSITTAPNCTAATCSPSAIRDLDVAQWYTELGSQLPAGTATVTGAGAGTIFTVTVMWDDARTGVAGVGCNPANPADLMCHSIDLIP